MRAATGLAIASFLAFSAATTVDLVERRGSSREGYSGGGGGEKSTSRGSTTAKSGSVYVFPGSSGRSTYQFVADECYDEALNPVTFHGDDNKKWIQVNENSTATNWTTPNVGQNDITGDNQNTNWYFDIYDAYYNGSVSLKLDPPENAPCEGVQTTVIPYSYFRIGQMSRSGGKYSRKDYDSKNLFFFRLGRTTGADNKCQVTPRKLFSSFESSNNGLKKPVVWTLQSSKSGDKFDISGNLTTEYANENNYFNVLPFASSNTTNQAECPSHFYAATLTKENQVVMNGTVSNSTASISWTFTDWNGWKVTGTFTGSHWSEGASLDLSGAQPQTTGEAKRVLVPGAEEDYVEKHETGIIAGTVVGGTIFLALLAGLGFFLYRRRQARKQYKEAKQVDHDDAWAMEDHHDELKEGTTTGLKTLPPDTTKQSLLGHNIDTSYDAHRSPSPSPSLPAYTEHYTPLK